MAPKNKKQSVNAYNVRTWGCGYFRVDTSGYVTVACQADESANTVRLVDIIKQAQHQGLSLPLLVRVPAIIHDRMSALQNAFHRAITNTHYHGQYHCIYPIKVNQQRDVLLTVLTSAGKHIGLEAGSKPELMAIMAVATPNKHQLVCNGYKDEEYMELAFIARAMGHRITITIERFDEVNTYIGLCRLFDDAPDIGLRVRLSTVAHGNWQNTGGTKSKFGLNAAELIEAVALLNNNRYLSRLRLLHFHMGSQIADIADIHACLREGIRYFASLRTLGAPLHTINVGGGLGVDYEGTTSKRHCSINYTLADYADTVVSAIHKLCAEQHLAHPHIMTEAGRAIVAHHALLLTDTIAMESTQSSAPMKPASDTDITTLWSYYQQALMPATQKVTLTHSAATHARQLFDKLCMRFNRGEITLHQKAHVESIYSAILQIVDSKLDPCDRLPQDRQQAHKYFCNFSLFQSLPDAWAIDQIFPIMPIQALDKLDVTRRVTIQDLTCDSDGRIDAYVNAEGISHSLPVPVSHNEPPVMAFFLVGAYQETLGDCHNLFGHTDSINVIFDGVGGGYRVTQAKLGQTRDEVLRPLGFTFKALSQSYQRHLIQAQCSPQRIKEYMSTLHAGLTRSTYFEPSTLSNEGDTKAACQ